MDCPITFVNKHVKCYDTSTMAFPFVFVGNSHSNFVYSMTKIHTFVRILL